MGSRVPAVLGASVAVLVAGAVAASAGDSDRSRTTRLTVQVQSTSLSVVDTGATGASPGDMVLDDVDVRRGGRRIGTGQFTCVAHAGDLLNGHAQCTGTVYLAHGRIETQGDARSNNGVLSGSGAVTGGTARYHGVRGSYSFRTTSDTERTLRFRLIR